jgi:hypothetical protein
MSTYALQGPFMKLKRADLHMQPLHAAMKGSSTAILTTSGMTPIEAKTPYVESFIVRPKENKRPPREEWGAMIGDVFHNLRSALDHLVWELTKRHQGIEPSPPFPSGRGAATLRPATRRRGI